MIKDQPEADFIDALSRNMNDYERWSRKRLRFSITRHTGYTAVTAPC